MSIHLLPSVAFYGNVSHSLALDLFAVLEWPRSLPLLLLAGGRRIRELGVCLVGNLDGRRACVLVNLWGVGF